VVRIVERTPLAVLKASAGFQLVDQAGVVMQTTSTRPAGYPLIVLPDDASKHTRRAEFAATAAVLAALPAGMPAKVGTASATGAEDVTLRLASGVTVVWGGPGDAALKSSVLARLVKAAPHASVYDVSAPNSPVTR
jgi:cell division protein FtsQ